MLSKAWNWVKNREPATVAAVVLVGATAAATAIANLPPETTWPAAFGAALLAVVRAVVTPVGKT
jgi:hypothetical protein